MSVAEWHDEVIGKKVVENLKKNGFDAVYYSEREKAVEHVLSFISPGIKVGIGGSMTLTELNIPDRAALKGADVLDHNIPGLSREEKREIRRQQLICDLFLSGTNALTLDGYLVNVDGVGNRVAAMTFGPKKVVIVAGMNKICRDVEAGFERIKSIASPRNNKRLSIANPCISNGVCTDCQGETRICRIYSVIKKKPMDTDITVVLIGEDLGY